jgi:hypothetical protein
VEVEGAFQAFELVSVFALSFSLKGFVLNSAVEWGEKGFLI